MDQICSLTRLSMRMI